MDKPNISAKQLAESQKPAAPKRTPPKKSEVPPERTGGGGVKAFFKGLVMVLLTIILVGATTAAICGMAAAVYINRYIIPEADVDLSVFQNKIKETSFIYYRDKNGNEVELQKLHAAENRVWAPISEIPDRLLGAFISVEDNTFYTHQGVSWRRTIGAGLNFVVGIDGFKGGGSTITQQLIKNVTGDDETSVHRKILEIFRALELEKNYSKDEILELYLNTIYFGQGAYGVRQAAQTYFSKEMHELTIAECAAIAGIVRNPYKYDILRFPEENALRRKTVLGEMLEVGNITQAEYDKAIAEKVVGVRRISAEEDEINPDEYQSYYVDAVIDAVIADLIEEKGYSEQIATSLLYTGGLKIVIPIDMELQGKMDAVFKDVENFPGDLGSTGTYPQAAMVLMDPETGHVLALYGGRGEKYGDRIFNRAVRAHRQPGSAIKPLTVYTPAFEMLDGFLPISVIDDAPKDFEVNPSGWPKNENRKYSGRTTIYRGVGSSLNTIAVGVMQMITPERAFTYARNAFQFDPERSLIKEKTVTYRDGSTAKLTDMAISPLALGGLTNGVTTLEMTAAYSAFVNGGYFNEPILYTAVYAKDSSGNYDMHNPLLQNSTATSERVMTTRTRDYMLDLLQYVTKNGTGTKARIDGVEVGGKTGTTSDDNDRWFAGITPDFAAVVWFGYDMPQSLQKFSTNPSLELWHRVMTSVYADLEEGEFTPAFGRVNEYTTVNYCADSGMPAGDACAVDYRGSSRVVSGQIQKDDAALFKALGTCTMHRMVEIDIGTGCVAHEYCPTGTDAAGNPLRKQIGALVMDGPNRRAYPSGGVAIIDHEYVLHIELTELEIAQGLHNPTTPSKIVPCTVHNEFNDGSVLPFDPMNPLTWPEGYNPIDPLTGLPMYPIDPYTGLPIYPPNLFLPDDPVEPIIPTEPAGPEGETSEPPDTTGPTVTEPTTTEPATDPVVVTEPPTTEPTTVAQDTPTNFDD